MSKRTISILLWTAAVIFTLIIFGYQRMTGPTHPVKNTETFNGKEVSYKLPRSENINVNLPIRLYAPDQGMTAYINYKHYKVAEEPWKEIKMTRDGDYLAGEIPGESQRAAKIEYIVRVVADGQDFLINGGRTIVARFRGAVPAFFLIIHIVFMVFSFIFAVRTGLEALRKDGNYNRLVTITLVIVFIGGLILGPIVQKYAFGDLWTGFPFGIDLTDNKTLVAFIFWLLADIFKKRSRWLVVIAAAVMLAVYLVPHSLLGSELDYRTGQMKNKYSKAQIIQFLPAYPPTPQLSKESIS